MTLPTPLGPTESVEPGAIVFIEDPYATGFTDDEIRTILSGGSLPAIKVKELKPGRGLTAAADVQTGAMIAFIPRDEDSEQLALGDGEPVAQLHCTSIYLGDAADFDDESRGELIATLVEVAPNIPPIVANVFGFAVLNPGGDEPCLVANVGGADLWDAQEIICGLSDEYEWASPEQHSPWLAHITLGYGPDPRVWMTDDVLGRTGPILFDRIRVAFAGVTTDIPLGDASSLQAATFHLAGKHSQKDHGRGRHSAGPTLDEDGVPEGMLVGGLRGGGWQGRDDEYIGGVSQIAHEHGFSSVGYDSDLGGSNAGVRRSDSNHLNLGPRGQLDAAAEEKWSRPGGNQLELMGVTTHVPKMDYVIAHEAGHRVAFRNGEHDKGYPRMKRTVVDYAIAHNRTYLDPGGPGSIRVHGSIAFSHSNVDSPEHGHFMRMALSSSGLSSYGTSSWDEMYGELYAAHYHGSQSELVQAVAAAEGW